MKDFLKYLKNNPKRMAIFLIPIIMLVLLSIYLFPDDQVNLWVKIGSFSFVLLVLFLLILQKWREYKGWEGLFGRK